MIDHDIHISPGTNFNNLNGSARDQGKPKSIPFPVEALPVAVQQFIQRCYIDLGYNKDFLAGGILAAVSAAVGRSYAVRMKAGWSESCNTWVCLIGRPGSGKSHPLMTALFSVHKDDKEKFAIYQQEKEAYKAYMSLSKEDKNNLPEPPLPVFPKTICSDTTLEALAGLLQKNNRGVLLHSDEIGGWLSNFNKYNSGSDLESWLSLWSGNPLTVDRVSREPIFIQKPFVSVAGTAQPGVIQNLFKGKVDNGFTDRMLFVWPEQIPARSWQTEEVTSDIFTEYNRAIERLLSEKPTETNELRFSKETEQVFANFYNDLQQRIKNEQDERAQSLLSKLDIHCARLSLIIQMMRYAFGEADKTFIDTISVESAIKLTAYFESQARKVRQHVFESTPVEKLDKTKTEFYESLPETFKTQKALDLGVKYDYSERTVKYFLNDKTLFQKISYGVYERLF